MDRLLSIIFVVRDAERTLEPSVRSLVDILSDTADRFEILIVDEGSGDQTLEVADELAALFPQVRVVRHAPAGDADILRDCRDQLFGDAVLLRSSEGLPPWDELRHRWEAASLDSLASTAAKPPTSRFDTPHALSGPLAGGHRAESPRRYAIRFRDLLN